MKRVGRLKYLSLSLFAAFLGVMLFTTTAFAGSNVTVRVTDITKPSEVYQGGGYPLEFSFIASKPAGESFSLGETFEIPTNLGDLFSSSWKSLNNLSVKNSEGKCLAKLSFSPKAITVSVDEAAAGEVEFEGTFTSTSIFTAKNVGAQKDTPAVKQLTIGDKSHDVTFNWSNPSTSDLPVDIDTFWKNADVIAPGNAARMCLEVNPIGSMDLYGYSTSPNPRKPQVWDNMVMKDVIPGHGFIDPSTVQIYAAIPAVGQRNYDWKANGWYDVPAGTRYAQRKSTMRYFLNKDWNNIPAQMKQISQKPGESAQQFEQRINDNPLTWGIYTAADNTQTFLCNFGRVGDPENNNGIMYETWMPNMVQMYPDIFGKDSITGGNVVSYYVEFDTYYPDVVDGSSADMTNTATLGNQRRSASYTVAADKGIGSVRRNNVRVKVVDEENPSVPIVGAEFVLQAKQDGNWVDTTLKVSTNEKGIAQFGPLPIGQYRLRQMTTNEGYTFDNTSFSNTGYEGDTSTGVNRVGATGECEITLDDNFGFGSLVINKRIHPSVSYEFVSNNASFTLPAEVLAKLPANETVEFGATVAPKQLAEKDLRVETADGTWVFTGWDSDSQAATADLTFIGTWRFEAPMKPINQLPQISASDKTINAGDKFDVRADVSASDPEDGDLTDSIEVVENTVDPATAGTYKVVYKVTDSMGASVTKEIKVTVIKKVSVSYEFVSNNASFTLPAEVLAKLPASYEVVAGKTVTPVSLSATDQLITTAAGTWKFEGWDLQSQVATSDVTFIGVWSFETSMSLINHFPVITAEDRILYVGDPFDPWAGVSAYDEEDGDLTSSVEIYLNTVVPSTPGAYAIRYDVTDSAGATTTKTVGVTVLQRYTVAHQFVCENSVMQLPEQVLAQLPASYKIEAGSVATPHNPAKTVVTTDEGTWTFVGWTPTTQRADSDVVFTGTWHFESDLVDINYPPVINATDRTLYVGDSFDPWTGISAIDHEDGDITSSITVDANTVDPSVAGKYCVTYSVVDSAGIRATKSIGVTVIQRYEVSYAFQSNNASFELPEGVTNLVPSSFLAEAGTVVSPVDLSQKVVPVDGGTWVFDGWSSASEVLNSNVCFVGTWHFECEMPAVNAIPTISAKDLTLHVGDKFDPLADVSASDEEDGDLTAALEIVKNNVDPSTAGTYSVTYKVVDSKGACAFKTIVVEVFAQQDTTEESAPAEDNKKPGLPVTADSNALVCGMLAFFGFVIVVTAIKRYRFEK